jgi:hypothetical protein
MTGHVHTAGVSPFRFGSFRSELTRATRRISLRSTISPLKSLHYYIAIMLHRIFPASSITPITCASWNAGAPIICG